MKTATRQRKVTTRIPQSWVNVVGILKGRKKVNALAYQRKVRKNWRKRLTKLNRLVK